jgi:DNA-directed RNA polymerase subunit beta
MKELQSLALDVKVFGEAHEEIEIKESVEDELDQLDVNIKGADGIAASLFPREELLVDATDDDFDLETGEDGDEGDLLEGMSIHDGLSDDED